MDADELLRQAEEMLEREDGPEAIEWVEMVEALCSALRREIVSPWKKGLGDRR